MLRVLAFGETNPHVESDGPDRPKVAPGLGALKGGSSMYDLGTLKKLNSGGKLKRKTDFDAPMLDPDGGFSAADALDYGNEIAARVYESVATGKRLPAEALTGGAY
jgi:hypothetical protein